jgi:hypothetical protein
MGSPRFRGVKPFAVSLPSLGGRKLWGGSSRALVLVAALALPIWPARGADPSSVGVLHFRTWERGSRVFD